MDLYKLHAGGLRNPILIAVATLGFLCSCSADVPFEESDKKTDMTGSEETITFNIRIDSDAETRSGRQLWSRAARQQVNDLRIYAFTGTGENALFYKSFRVDEFLNLSPNFTQTENVKLKGEFADGTYSFLAVGLESDLTPSSSLNPDTGKTENRYARENNRYYISYGNATAGQEPVEGQTRLGDMIITLKEAGNADEVFAGRKEGVTIDSEAGVKSGGDITLYRVPAGVLAYFEHIPYELPNPATTEMERVTGVVLSASGISSSTYLKEPFQPYAFHNWNYPGEDSYSQFEIVLLSFDMTPLPKSEEGNWYRISSNDWRAEGLTEAPAGVKKLADSVLGGCFILPYRAGGKTPTLAVKLVGGKDGKTFLKRYEAVCAEHEAEQGHEGELSADPKIFDIKANHFYGLGVKYSDSGIDPSTPDRPEPFEPDDPVDLSKEQVIRVTVKAAWDKRHDLTF